MLITDTVALCLNVVLLFVSALRCNQWGCFINNYDNSDTLKEKQPYFSADVSTGKIKRPPKWQSITLARRFIFSAIFPHMWQKIAFIGVSVKNKMPLYQRLHAIPIYLKQQKRRVQDLNLRARSTRVRRISSPVHYHSANSP